MTNQEIINTGQTIANETHIGGNTAERVGGVIKAIGENLTELDEGIYPWTCVINAGLYREPATFQSLTEALGVIPSESYRKKALLYYIDNLGNPNVFIYISSSISADNWNNTSYWKRILSEKDALALFESKNNKTTVISENSTDGQFPSAKATYNFVNNLYSVIAPINSEFRKLKTIAEFNNSIGTSDSIVLQNEGDFIEIEILNVAGSAELGSGKFGLATYAAGYVSISVTANHIFVRADDRTWICNSVAHNGGNSFILRVAYEEGCVNTYINGILISSYNGLKKITLKRWGVYTSGSDYYWKGAIGTIVINGTTYENISYIPGWNSNTVNYYTQHGFLTEEQAAQLDQVSVYPNIIVSATSSSVDVYNKVHNNIYAKFTINHQVDTSTGQYKYKDLWRIASRGDLCVYDGESFTSLGIKLLVSAENEFAIKFAGFLDFTGGYHGYERIDLDPSCYCVFVLDGKEYTISDLVSLGDVNGNSFGYRQKSFCYTDSGYSQSPIHFANHVKRTLFECGGFVTRNYFEVILDDLSVSSLTAESAFEGLVCVSEDCADKVVGVDGTIYPTAHPATSVILVNNINKISRFVKMFNGAVSCCLDAKMVGTSVSGYATPGNRVQIMDRADDAKYYAYLPSNVAWSNGDAMEVECVVKYDYRPSN